MYKPICSFIIFVVFLVFTNSGIIKAETQNVTRTQNRTWDQAIALAKEFVAQMTLEEKCNMTAGVKGHCVGVVLPVPRLNFSGLCLLDSASGVGDDAEFSTAFAPGIQIAATWDRDLFYRRAAAIGQEFRGKGIHYALGPMMNIDRNARHGRNWEGFGADPYLSGENSFYFVQGLQDQGVVATAKHYICNEQETHRHSYDRENINSLDIDRDPGYSANLDDKTIHEVYLWPFADSVVAGIASVMCAYNRVNGTLACQNNKTLNGLLKGELEFRGNIMSDWNAVRNGVEAALAGLDLDMPGFDDLMGYSLLSAVKNGTIPESKLDNMVVRILTPYYLLGQDQNYPLHNSSLDMTANHYLLNRQVGAAGMVLLKNTKNVLPLNTNTDKYFSIYGSAASRYDIGLDPRNIDGLDGALYQGGGSGFVRSIYFLDPLTSLLIKARDSHIQMQYVVNQDDYNNINRSLVDAKFSKGKCLVFINAWSSEGRDRTNLSAYHDGDRLVKTVASNCASTIVIVNSVSQLNLEAWIDHPNVTGVIWSGLPGPEYGPAIVDVLFGDYNPGGKLVFTIAKNDSDYGTDITETDNSNYTEGVFIDYRHFDLYNITPRYYFGYGLSYTTFSFSEIIISRANKETLSGKNTQRRRSYTNEALLKLYEPIYTVTFTMINTGNLDGSEVSQLYLGFPREATQPLKVLRGFERVYLMAGESKTVALTLAQRDISYWNVIKQEWIVAPGKYTVWISTSANTADIKLKAFLLYKSFSN